MSLRVIEQVNQFARMQGVSPSLPVDLSVLKVRFTPEYVDLTEWGTIGYGLFAGNSGDHHATGRIMIEQSLTIWEQRLVYAHEMGHFIIGHTSSPITSSINSWQHGRDEHEAWLAATALLVPIAMVEPGMTEQELAGWAAVPVDLIRTFWHTFTS